MQDCEGKIEKGNPHVTIGAYVKALSVLGLENDIMEVGKDDKLGTRLHDAKLIVRERAPKILKSNKLRSSPQVSKMIIKGQASKVRLIKKDAF